LYRVGLPVVLGCVVGSAGLLAQEAPLPRIVMERAAYFLTPDGAAVPIAAGGYTVEVTDGPALRLTGQDDASTATLLAASTRHDEQLSGPSAALILTGEDAVHLVLLYPDGTALDATGSLSGIQPRGAPPSGPGTSPIPLTQGQIHHGLQLQGLQASAGMVRPAGVPPVPVLTMPPVGHRIAAWGEQFEWRPGTGDPSATTYQLCIAEAGSACPRAGQPSTTAVVIANLPATLQNYRVTGAALQPLLAYGQQKNLTWTVGACAPSSTTTALGRVTGGAITQVTCQYARPRAMTWKNVLKAPIAISPEPLINDRPRFSIQEPVEGAHHYLFCVVDLHDQLSTTTSICETASQERRIHDAGASVSSAQASLVNTGTSLSTSGWEWKSEAPSLPFPNAARVSVVGISFSTTNLSVGACLNEPSPCSWSSPIDLTMLPVFEGPRIRRESPSRFKLEWQGATSTAVTHYRLCIAVRGDAPLVRPNFPYELIYFPGMLRDLCSGGDVPPGQQPAYQRPLPLEVAGFCPVRGCQMPRPVKTIYVTGQPRYILDLHEHPELAPVGGKPLVLAVAACSNSNWNCLWWIFGSTKFDLPVNSREPSVDVRSGTSSFSLEWEPWWGNDFYIPCVREPNATCDTGNLLSQPRLDSPRRGTPQDHPQKCALSGPSLSGKRVIQVAGCNDAWGCRWSPPREVNLSGIRLPPRQSVLRCSSP